MTNTNCLEDHECPECGSEDRFSIAAETIVTVDDEGTDDFSDVEWFDDSYCRCHECDHVGTVDDFHPGGSYGLSPAAETIKELTEALEGVLGEINSHIGKRDVKKHSSLMIYEVAASKALAAAKGETP